MHKAVMCCSVPHGPTLIIVPKHDMSDDVSMTRRHCILSTFPLAQIIFMTPLRLFTTPWQMWWENLLSLHCDVEKNTFSEKQRQKE